MSDNIITIKATVNVSELQRKIEKATKLDDEQAMFKALASYEAPKQELENALAQVKEVEAEIKAAINAKASKVIGKDWAVIKGDGYKINRSPTGPVFIIAGNPQRKYVVVKKSVDTKAVEATIKERGKVPAGIEYNGNRGSSIKVKVDLPDDNS